MAVNYPLIHHTIALIQYKYPPATLPNLFPSTHHTSLNSARSNTLYNPQNQRNTTSHNFLDRIMALSSEQSKKQSQTQTQTQTQKQQSTHPSSLQSKAGVQHPDSCPRDSGKHANSNVGRKSTGNGGGGRNGDEANKGEHGPGGRLWNGEWHPLHAGMWP